MKTIANKLTIAAIMMMAGYLAGHFALALDRHSARQQGVQMVDVALDEGCDTDQDCCDKFPEMDPELCGGAR